jgi:uroporphyrinogen-III synthase
MAKTELLNNKLGNLRIAVPESRQLDTMARLLEKRGAQVLRIPLIAIHDTPDEGPVLAWIERFIASPPDLFIILTGEGVRRLLALADRYALKAALAGALSQTLLLCRGPKPARALWEIGLKSAAQANSPTTDGVIDSLTAMEIKDHRVSVQLYGDDPNTKLVTYLESRQSRIDTVSPYVYADEADEKRVLTLIHALNENSVDVIAFTSQPQFRRLEKVAKKHALFDEMLLSLNQCCVAAIGPVVKRQLQESGIKVDIMPEQAFFMKPLVTEIMHYFQQDEKPTL